jgi:RNA polymerase sigma factor (sigma-70 family)
MARRIATRAAIDYLRSSERTLVPPGQLERTPRSTAADPAQQAEIRERIERAFGLLPARLRAAAALSLIEERPYREIAGALDISLSAVKMRVARAVRLLRISLEKMGIRP